MTRSHDDLLQPTLAPDFDVRRFQRPWTPTSIVWVAFLGGPLAAGLVFGLNYRRLARPSAARIAWIATPPFALLVAFGIALAYRAGWLDVNDATHARIARLFVQFLSIGAGWLVARDQEQAFRAYSRADLPVASLWLPGLGAVLLGSFAYSALLRFALGALGVGP
ncbi:MAG: hypothetical protein ACKVWV_00550 [Planctomycetota bacterium]